MRRRRNMACLLPGLLALGLALPVHAETFYGGDDWNVAFTSDRKMVSTFTTADINDVVSGMQPGDNVIITLDLKNANSVTTDWYMQNEVLYSLEDRSANKQTGGGAYTYRLVYTDTSGAVNVLFDSDTVGGESMEDAIANMGEGLHGATNALKDYFYLDTIYYGQGGTITLEVALDGETQGNHYQDTLADLQMNFAVELREDIPPQPANTPTPVSDEEPTPAPAPGRGTDIVKTSDESQLPLLAAISGVTGVILLVYCIYCFREHRRRKHRQMKRLKRCLCTLFTLCLAFLTVLPVSAKEKEYTYTIRFFSGRQGLFAEGEVKVLEGLHYGDRISFSQSSVKLNDNSKYYIRGIRESGKDNSESTQASSFLVTGDMDYVIAYGILGDATSYTINYVDGAGNALAPSETYYGNVGDRPVVAYLYIDGWQPQAYNMTQTLEKDPAENVFNFVYTRVEVPVVEIPGPVPAPAPEAPAPEPPVPVPAAPVAEPPTDEGGITVIPAVPDDGGTPPVDDGTEPDNGGTTPDDGQEQLEEQNTPQGAPQELENLDDENVPTGNFLAVAADARLLGIPVPVIIVLALGAVGAAMYFLILRKRKKATEEEEES